MKKEEKLAFADDDHQMVVGQFEEYQDNTSDIRGLASKCRDYYDGNQYTDTERKVFAKRKQPCITDNKIQDKVNTLLGIEKKMRTDPKAYPRNPSPEDEESAEAATDALRYIADKSRYKTSSRKEAAENLAIEGMCAGQVVVEKKRGQTPYVCMEHIRWDRGFYDIHSLKRDFSDKTYDGFFTWMDYDIGCERWTSEEALEALEQSVSSQSQAGPDKDMDDKPRYVMTTRGRKRVQVFEHYFLKKGKWMFAVWCRGGWLEKPRPSPYKDEYGQPQCPIERQALYRDSEGAPYGEVPRYLDLQDEHNKRRSKMLHLLNAKRIIAQKGMISNLTQAREELHKPDGLLEINGDITQFKIEDNLAEAEGQWRLLQQTDMALSQTGPNAALAGTSGDLSGIAKARDQQAGELPITPMFDALDAWELRMYCQAWNRVRQFWTAETWIRVTDDENKIKFVGLNIQGYEGDRLAKMAAKNPEFQQASPEEQRGVIEAIAQRPEAQQQRISNPVGEMDIDIIIDRGQDVVTVQQEEFAQLVEIAKGRPEIPFDAIVEMSQLRPTTKKRVLDRMKGEDDPAAQQRAQMQAMIEQLNAALLQANVRKVESEAAKNEAATAETQVDASVKVATFTSPNGGEPEDSKTQVNVN